MGTRRPDRSGYADGIRPPPGARPADRSLGAAPGGHPPRAARPRSGRTPPGALRSADRPARVAARPVHAPDARLGHRGRGPMEHAGGAPAGGADRTTAAWRSSMNSAPGGQSTRRPESARWRGRRARQRSHSGGSPPRLASLQPRCGGPRFHAAAAPTPRPASRRAARIGSSDGSVACPQYDRRGRCRPGAHRLPVPTSAADHLCGYPPATAICSKVLSCSHFVLPALFGT